MCVGWEEGERLRSPGQGGGCQERGGDAPGSGRGRSSVSRGRANPGSSARVEPESPAPRSPSSLAFSITPSLPPSLLPGGRGGAGKAAKRSGPALEECGSAEGADPDAFSPRSEQPQSRRPHPAGRGPRTRAAGGNGTGRAGRAGRAGTRTPGPDRHTGSQTRIRPRGRRDAERARDIAADKEPARKGVPPDLNAIAQGWGLRLGPVRTGGATLGGRNQSLGRTRKGTQPAPRAPFRARTGPLPVAAAPGGSLPSPLVEPAGSPCLRPSHGAACPRRHLEATLSPPPPAGCRWRGTPSQSRLPARRA